MEGYRLAHRDCREVHSRMESKSSPTSALQWAKRSSIETAMS